jgi:membrane protease YdiL (CAAX protease family)
MRFKLKTSKIYYSLFFLSLCILNTLVFYLLSNRINTQVKSVHLDSTYFDILISVLITPIIETYIFQYFIFEKMDKWTKSTLLSLIITSLFFGLIHSFLILRIVKEFLSGIVYQLAYLKFRRISISPIINVIIIHSFHNLIFATLNKFF